MSDKTEIPTSAWKLDRLQKFLQACLRRTAVDAWKIGKALLIAKTKLKANREYVSWVKSVGLSEPTAWRYTQIANQFSVKEVDGRPLKEIYAAIEQLRNGRADPDVAEPDVMIPPAPPAPDLKQPVKKVVSKSLKENSSSDEIPAPSTHFDWEVPQSDFDEFIDAINAIDASMTRLLCEPERWSDWTQKEKDEVEKWLVGIKLLVDGAIEALSSTAKEKSLS